MALAAAQTRPIPKFTLVSKYEVERIRKYPVVRVTFTECNYLFSRTLVVESIDPVTGALTVPYVGDLAEAEVVGHILSDLHSNDLAAITAVTHVEVEPATETSAGLSVSVLTLDVANPAITVGDTVAIVDKMPVGTTAYEPARGGNSWTITLYGDNEAAMAKIREMVGTIYFTSGKLLLAELGITTVTDTDLFLAVQALGAEGTNVDGLYAQQGEALESLRQADNLTYAMVMGTPPTGA